MSSRILLGTLVLLIASLATAHQPPDGKGKGPPGKGRYELGKVFLPPLREELKLTPEQEKELVAIEKDLKEQLNKLLTDEQKKIAENFRPKGPGGPMGPGPGGPDRPMVEVAPDPNPTVKNVPRLVVGGTLKTVGDENSPFTLNGDAVIGTLGDARLEHSGTGLRLLSSEDVNKDGIHAGGATCTIKGLTPQQGRWYRLRVRGLAQDGFAVEKDGLVLKVEFFKDNGKNLLDHIAKSIYSQVERARMNLVDPGTNKSLGSATWQSYSIDFRTPFPEVDTIRFGIGFTNGTGSGKQSEFWVSEMEMRPIADPADYTAPAKPGADMNPPALKSLVKLGGRWYYDPRGAGGAEPPKQFDHTNAGRLYYLTDRLETPFVGNTSAWLRKSYLDRDGKVVEKDQFVPDAVVISFTDKHLVMKSKNLPNHPTAVFPDRSRFLDGNPNFIQEQRDTWYIPLEPKENPNRAAAMTMDNKRGLPMGPIGVATNGVVFFNPFDHIAEADAVWRLDRCCGHPSPSYSYHYHKYPVCVNTPWDDDGSGHSPLIGFAFDGFPVYGPYESAGVLAKDAKTNPLNESNLHVDEVRGPHYHVTPGKFPHIIGGNWGEVDPRNRQGKKGPPKQ